MGKFLVEFFSEDHCMKISDFMITSGYPIIMYLLIKVHSSSNVVTVSTHVIKSKQSRVL